MVLTPKRYTPTVAPAKALDAMTPPPIAARLTEAMKLARPASALPRLSLWALAMSVSGTLALGCEGKTNPTAETAPAPTTSAAVDIPGIDTSTLTPRERREWQAQVAELLAPCPDVPVSIAQCITENRSCLACRPAAEFLLAQVQAGKAKKQRQEAYEDRFDPKKVETIDLDGSPQLGPDDALVTIVEWADFECPTCRLFSPILDGVYERFGGQVRVVYKFYPLKAHPNGEIAARAGIAAWNQGKFWEMHHLMFDNQGRLARSDLEKMAQDLGLDMARFKKDLTDPATTQRIEADVKQADGLGLSGTPTVYINGRELDVTTLTNALDDVVAWVELDIRLMGKEPKPAPPKKGAKPEKSPPLEKDPKGEAPDAGAKGEGEAPPK